MQKTFVQNIDMFLLWIFLFFETKALYKSLQALEVISFFDIIFNYAFLILILIVIRLIKKENLFVILLDLLEIRPKKDK
ncbi:hypothetical protein [Sulfurimonas marina]|uniref:Uncharacterized protein n=1 Tax=Sulfurimonas marina TaxID=2590551 RepID=A0A7M1AVF2_9BACT|nr:hypothetical protein [Sulfurimonas marina]QOP41394.1 hypothetical protein FJR03_06405 [Sulfurimonas marina]